MAGTRKVRYDGPAVTFNGQDVPIGGLEVALTEEQQLQLESHGHRFEPSMEELTRPTPVEAADTGGVEVPVAAPAVERKSTRE